MAQESWVRHVARRAVLPAIVVERVLAAMLEAGPDPALPADAGFEAAIRAALATTDERRRAAAAEIADRAYRPRRRAA